VGSIDYSNQFEKITGLLNIDLILKRKIITTSIVLYFCRFNVKYLIPPPCP
jgi:hypothetical protein